MRWPKSLTRKGKKSSNGRARRRKAGTGLLAMILAGALPVFVVAGMVVVLLTVTGTVERVSIHAIDAMSEVALRPSSVSETLNIARDNRTANDNRTNFGSIILIATVMVLFFVLAAFSTGSRFMAETRLALNAYNKTQKATARKRTRVALTPIEPIGFLGEANNGT